MSPIFDKNVPCAADRVCVPNSSVDLFPELARRSAVKATGRNGGDTIGGTFVSGRTVREPDPIVSDNTDRLLAVLLWVGRCPIHRADTAVPCEPSQARRIEQRVLAYLTADQARRATAERDLIDTGADLLRDHARQLTAGGLHTARPSRKAAGFRAADGQRLLTAVQCELWQYLVRGVEAGERIAAATMLGEATATDADAVGYLRRLAVTTYRSAVVRGRSAVVEIDDDEICATLAALRDPQTWAGADLTARRCFADLVGKSRVLLALRLDRGWDTDAGSVEIAGPATESDAAKTMAGEQELRVWRQVREDGWRLGPRVFTELERVKITRRIARLEDFYE